jgi:tetratricopeptide (TPR) repeat protein
MLFSLLCLPPAPAFGQTKGGGSPTTPPSGATGPGTPATPNTTATPSTTAPAPVTPTIVQPVFVTGRVMLEDGTAPPESVLIESVCNGNPHGEGYTDGKGYFGIELGNRNNVIQDASETTSIRRLNSALGPVHTTTGTGTTPSTSLGGMDPMERKYMGCDLQARLAGYRSQQIPLTGRRSMDDPDIGIILLHRVAPGEEGQTVSMVSLAAPKDAKKAYDKALDAIKRKKWDEAETSLEKAVEIYPKYASAWYELGMIQAGAEKPDMARSYFKKALDCDPKFVKPYLQLTALAVMAKRWQEVAEHTDTIVKLDPFSYPQAWFYHAVASYNLHDMEAAEKSALETERLDTHHQFPRVNFLLGLVFAQRKDYEGAAKRFNAYLAAEPNGEDAPTVRAQLATIAKITAAAKDPQQ